MQESKVMVEGKIKIQKIDDYRWRIPREGKMRTDGIIYSDERMFTDIRKDQSLVQVTNVAWLPGIVGHSLAMPDIHWGYGFPIGGVAGFDMDEGVVSPGGVGYDIN
jgi:tRNA-splicing ligase RtcB